MSLARLNKHIYTLQAATILSTKWCPNQTKPFSKSKFW